jgi:hypothetical protein
LLSDPSAFVNLEEKLHHIKMQIKLKYVPQGILKIVFNFTTSLHSSIDRSSWKHKLENSDKVKEVPFSLKKKKSYSCLINRRTIDLN